MIEISHTVFSGSDGKTIIGSTHRCCEQGGTWVVFAHGLTGHRLGPHYLYVKISRALAEQDISSLRFDFAGSGESDGAFSDMTLITMRADLLAAIRLLKRTVRPAHLIILGHSLGGTVASLVTTDVCVDGLVLIAPVADPLGIKQRREQIISRGPNHNGFYENGPHEMGLNFLTALEGVDPVVAMQTGFKGRLLLLQGDADPSVSVAESGRYGEGAAQSDIPVRIRIFNGVDHNFTTVDSTRTICSIIPAWIMENFV